MPAVKASAPGKAILLGEHAAVYGRPALAVPVHQVHAQAIVQPEIRASKGVVKIIAHDIGYEGLLTDLEGDHPFRIAVEGVCKQLGLPHFPAATIHISSTIPVASGLGSSAAISVALIRAAAAFAGFRLGDEEVSNLAFRVEQRMHGTPSGIDNTVVSFAKPIFFQKDIPVEVLHLHKPVMLVIADTGVKFPTAEAVSGVRQRWEQNPSYYDMLFDEVANLVHAARLALNTGDLSELGMLMDENQHLLEKIGVSSPELERLVAAAIQAGALGAKLSGGGQGGNMIALVQTNTVDEVQAALLEAGAVKTIITTIPATDSDS